VTPAGVDYEVEYNNRARVPEHPVHMAAWTRDAAAWRAAQEGRSRIIRYDSGPRHTIEFYPALDEGPIVVFIHGGYWQAFDASSFSHLAAGLHAHGIDVAIPSYELCPNVSVADIIAQMQTATRELARLGRPIVMSGHSAGGHLAACMMATDWRKIDPSLPQDLVSKAYSISGLFDLVPLVGTSVNKALRLDEASAKASSPMLWPPPRHGVLDAVVGARESAEYHRQSRQMAEKWGGCSGITTRYESIAGADHFTVIAPLADPGSAMTLRLKQLAA
jgi:arylformamidase